VSLVSLVNNDFLSGRDLALQTFLEVRRVVIRRLEGSINPDKSIQEDRYSKLVAKTSLIKLVGVCFRVLGKNRMNVLRGTTVYAVDGGEEGRDVISVVRRIGRIPLLRPNNLVE